MKWPYGLILIKLIMMGQVSSQWERLAMQKQPIKLLLMHLLDPGLILGRLE
jgi:hypothetical protein